MKLANTTLTRNQSLAFQTGYRPATPVSPEPARSEDEKRAIIHKTLTQDLLSKTVKELRLTCKGYGIKGYSNKRKQAIIELLISHLTPGCLSSWTDFDYTTNA